MDLEGTKARIKAAVQGIKEQYNSRLENRPWLIGYSGGKDSTCTAQLVFRSLLELKEEGNPLSRRVVIFSSDTMIENPLVKNIIEENIALINKKAKEERLPVEAVILRPDISRSFWVNVIGRGYPCPNTMFRWCTDRLKIEPANNFVKNFIDKNGATIMLLGVRKGESQTRDRVLKTHGVKGERLMRHTTLVNAYIFAPIIELSTLDVFTYLSEFSSPWDSSNKELFMFYEESGGGDCPIFVSEQDKDSRNSCGNSRLGCWACTVVTKDKSLTGFISTGYYDYLKPLLSFRDWLSEIRDNDDYRYRFRMNGSIYFRDIPTKINNKTGEKYLVIPKKNNRDEVLLLLSCPGVLADKSSPYWMIREEELSDFMKKNGFTSKSLELARVLFYNETTDSYSRLGTGPFTHEAKVNILEKLLEAESAYNAGSKIPNLLISDAELAEVVKIWERLGEDAAVVNSLLEKFNREKVNVVRDEFDRVNSRYKKHLNDLADSRGLDADLLNSLIRIGKEHLHDSDRGAAKKAIENLFSFDRYNM